MGKQAGMMPRPSFSGRMANSRHSRPAPVGYQTGAELEQTGAARGPLLQFGVAPLGGTPRNKWSSPPVQLLNWSKPHVSADPFESGK